LLNEFAQTLVERTRQLPQEHPLRELATAFQSLATTGEELHELGPGLVARLFDTYPEFAPTFPRPLLWFFGGDCLHYMADKEIAEFQEMDEIRVAAARRGEIVNLQESRAKLLKLQ
jgi:hypothetical protein